MQVEDIPGWHIYFLSQKSQWGGGPIAIAAKKSKCAMTVSREPWFTAPLRESAESDQRRWSSTGRG